ncbi:hypothetical protein RJT34_26693 [Clitoria ternatea]|uniref:NDH-dependent cyclic electron flow 5 n=1 Tax=Clitoria ternatea TaxID=43366 RepID=A0AAN9F750_CLITE
MTMALSSSFYSSLFTPTSTVTCARTTPPHTCLPSASYIPHKHSKREFPLPAVASVPYQPINLEYLEAEFSGHGVTFEGVGDSCIAKMELKNGSIVTMMLPSGLITSYKAPMWHGGKMELLHTAVSEGESGDAIIQGGVSLNFNFQTDDDGEEISWSPSSWVLHKIKGNAKESIRVELLNRASDDKIGLKYIVTLEEDALSSKLEISNKKSLPLQMTGCILSHLTVSSPEATYAIGLLRSNYCIMPLFESEFSLSPLESGQDSGFGKLQNLPIIKQLFQNLGTKNQSAGAGENQRSSEEMDEEMEEEVDDYKKLSKKTSLVYTNSPRSFTVIDRGRRNSVTVGRNGFDEMYLFSPGSEVEIYSKYSYICVGQAAILKPILLGPKDVWKGGQYIHNPNL